MDFYTFLDEEVENLAIGKVYARPPMPLSKRIAMLWQKIKDTFR